MLKMTPLKKTGFFKCIYNLKINSCFEFDLSFYVTWIWIFPLVHPKFYQILAHFTMLFFLIVNFHCHTVPKGLILLSKLTKFWLSKKVKVSQHLDVYGASPDKFLISSLTILTWISQYISSFLTYHGVATILQVILGFRIFGRKHSYFF